jgi:predicted pyridoxine 5'-phosphate oxidase superfamily flavin-nucleotide-binding protein
MTGPFHSGEREIQRRAGVVEDAQEVGRIIGGQISPAAVRFLARQRLAVASTVDSGGRVWASLLTGAPGFIAADGMERVRIAARPIPGDPLKANLVAGGRSDVGLVVLDPQTRQRMRLNGTGELDDHGLRIDVRQLYGNCPKYIQLREAQADAPAATAGPPVVAARLGESQRAWVQTADTLFIATFHPEGGADASHRGGFPGFVRVLGDGRLAFPDYPGNAMFNTLGNLLEYPRAGLLFVDFETGDVLQLTGRATLEGDRSVVFEIDETRETRRASPLRMRLVQYSPANPGLRPNRGAAPAHKEKKA